MSNSRNITFNHDLALHKRSRRVITIGTKVTPEFDATLRRLAQKNKLLLTEMLEKMLEVYLAYEQKIEEEAKEVKKNKNKETKVKSVKVQKNKK